MLILQASALGQVLTDVVVVLVFNYWWGLSCCWAIWPLYGCKGWNNGLICKYRSDHMSDPMRQIFIVYCVLLLCCAITSDLDNKDSDSGSSDYQFSTPKGLCLTRKVLQPLLIYLWLGVSGNGDIIDNVVPQCPCIG